jgi:hypothetical protein
LNDKKFIFVSLPPAKGGRMRTSKKDLFKVFVYMQEESSQLLLLSSESFMNLLRTAYEMDDESHMSTMKDMLSNHTVSRLLLHQLIEHLLVPSVLTTFIQDIERLKSELSHMQDEAECFKSHFVYYATALSHIYYVKRDQRTGIYALHSKSKPVFYSAPNEAMSYIWLTTNQYGMLAPVQHYAVDNWLPNMLIINLVRSSDLGDLLPLGYEIVISGGGGVGCVTLPPCKMWFKVNLKGDGDRLLLLRCEMKLQRPFVLLTTAGDNFAFVAVQMVMPSFSAPSGAEEKESTCQIKSLPVALHPK